MLIIVAAGAGLTVVAAVHLDVQRLPQDHLALSRTITVAIMVMVLHDLAPLGPSDGGLMAGRRESPSRPTLCLGPHGRTRYRLYRGNSRGTIRRAASSRAHARDGNGGEHPWRRTRGRLV